MLARAVHVPDQIGRCLSLTKPGPLVIKPNIQARSSQGPAHLQDICVCVDPLCKYIGPGLYGYIGPGPAQLIVVPEN